MDYHLFSEEDIRGVLKEYAFYSAMDFSIEEFCQYKQIEETLLQSWIDKHPDFDDDGFMDVNIIRSLPRKPKPEKQSAQKLFADVDGVKIYQPVSADFLKSLRL
jgi:hypothetical protein